MKTHFLTLLAILALVLAMSTVSSVADASAGSDLFKSKCVMCHGADGSGKTAMGEKFKISDLRSEGVQKQGDADLNKTISQGKEKMPPYGAKLSAEQITQLVGQIREFGKSK
jgi:cytochrome c6